MKTPRSENSPSQHASGGPSAGSSQALWRFSGVGLEFVAVVGGFTALGWCADRWLKTPPWFMLAGAVLGIIGGGVKFVRQAQAASRQAQEEYKRSHPDAGYRRIQDDDDENDIAN